MKLLRSFATTFLPLLIVAMVAVFFGSAPVGALSIQEGVQAAHGAGQPSQLFGADGVITTVTNVLLFIVGALSVIMIIIGGFRYVLSGGNSTAVTAAKNTILYAIVGLLVAFFAYAIVNWVLGAISPDGSGGWTNV